MRTPVPDIDQRIGARIRELRGAKGLTLDRLAEQADVSRAMLSRIERGESSPTAQLMNKVCVGLGITLSTLLAEPAAPASPVARRGAQPTWRDPATRYQRRNVSPAGSSVDIIEIEFPPRRSVNFDNMGMPGFEQHVWVLDGVLEMEVGDESFRLAEGDCLKMHTDRPILFRNPTRRQIRYAVIINRGASR
ncbi:XRE family transcriptional regulator [Bradyrhizobium sp. LHD-71]|uniref:helix-turn-helix domain-containing protein n=1 Tax=Bradyrhizobium sp. LHD-71 TaxID=3072141 RepID=UPI00280C872F|nr:XRE family transcriptional regulator [Bradyrhizobium sp. LHD-71]MDQ8728420.1 XRE family transcriptional regulator [Bradyrhizobium sp. LHD-71]